MDLLADLDIPLKVENMQCECNRYELNTIQHV